MIPHERTLVKRLADQPFTLLGINSDPADTYRAKRVDMEVTWPSFWDGGNTSGPIASKWGVSGWPTIYVLDHQGRIRFQGVRNEKMDEAVDQLLAELRGELPIPTTEALIEAASAVKPSESIPAATKVPAQRAGGGPPAAQGGEGNTVPATPLLRPAGERKKAESGSGR